MQILFLYLGVTFILICLILVIYALIYNKIQEIFIRIDESEINIDNNLRHKYDLINRIIALIKGNSKIDKEIFEEIVKLRSRKISNFDLDRKLIEAYNEFISIRNKYPEINKSDEIKKIAHSLEEIDTKLLTLKEYNNENILEYNKLIKTFPTNIVAKINRYNEKLFFDKKDMKDEDYKDFKL